ncbi:MAG: arylesterase [Candidatus Dactylopiibacterium carminicum]|uniref:Arylesterase n=1 Tax=Candidatus Dactylopiibacterium carminicum TaxID=857335 RepID=A0A272EUC8_9RHOO|nr:GDSL-type esterase/lipase family protein [Candidatus Dactylopiibacterium carminicum]KAF7599767.1 arylesterase [Candidatus Dactylopiibacterium carminicum]PAS93721.1 MAG: arylesterase [Candidatus Dactylopiibacterium carminicum]PAS98278.1 MAG: arylesterase [Candidatus Dactylopiibacterium carminicum]PAS99768.1 MAG: hypothetical protein BSR46_06125 [Candidatus Dactylopiibacterium carminicum]
MKRRGFLIVLCLLLSACGQRQQQVELPPGATVLVVGDSLVAGTGATRELSWPAVLARETGWQVVNAGVPGHRSEDARERLGALLAQYRPDAVIVAIGGNDFLRRVPETQTRENIAAMLDEARAVSAHVALVAIPAPSLGAALFGVLSDHPLYAALAGEQQVLLLPDAVAQTLSRPELRADSIHANAEGYEYMAELLRKRLVQAGWL